jgi:hypothetical protein
MSAKKPTHTIVVSGVAIIAALGITSLLMPGCFGRECDGDEKSWGPPTDVYQAYADAAPDALVGSGGDPRMSQGHLVDENTWESNAIGDDWLEYLHARALHLYYPQLGGRQPDQVTAYISANVNPNKTGDTFTAGGGNVAKFIGVLPGVATVKNDTCADFFVRVIVHVPPYADSGTASVTDAGSAGDASSVQDASTDAPKD